MAATKKWLYEVPGMTEYKGILCMPDMTPDILKWVDDELEFDERDVLLCAYPCSGDIWLQEVVWHLHHLDQIDQVKPSIGQRVPHIDHAFFRTKTPKDFFAEIPPPRVFKTRVPADLLTRHLNGKVKVIHWTMDPRDTVVKYYEMYTTKGRFFNFPPIEFDQFFELFQKKQLFEGDWFETSLSYLPYVGKDNFLFLRYEREAGDRKSTVRKLADFLAVDVTEQQVDDLAKVVPFDDVTDWRRRFSDAQLRWYKAKYEEKMKGTILENAYI